MTTNVQDDPGIVKTVAGWPDCQWRVSSDDTQLVAGIASCRHQRVRTPGHLVTLAVCESCSLRLTESPAAPVRAERTSCCGSVPSLLQKSLNAAFAVAQFIADGANTVTSDQYQTRLEVCETCDRRMNKTCTACGCNLTIKARGRVFQCPLNKWPVIPAT